MADLTILTDAAPEQLEIAAALNHRELFCLEAVAAGGEVREADGVTWTYAGPHGGSMIAFPVLAEDRAGAQLDEIVEFYLLRRPEALVGCWSLDPPQPRYLGAWLFARGFQPGWRPCWMALDLQEIRDDHPRPAGLKVVADGTTPTGNVPDLPNAHRNDVSVADFLQRHPERGCRFVATMHGEVVGHSMVVLATGPYGAAGIYNVGVVPQARNLGIGKAVTVAACLYAKECGYRHAVLNATGRRMYEQIGFRWVGEGCTWWLNVPRLAADPPSRDRIALAEAVGRGDLAALDALHHEGRAGDLDAPLVNGMTLLHVCVDCRQPESAEWLVEHGATLDPRFAWAFGWKERTARLLAEDPGRANERYGEWNTTLLHDAVEQNDVELARLVLSFRPDMTITDTSFHSTPLGWARHFGRDEIVRLIEEHAA